MLTMKHISLAILITAVAGAVTPAQGELNLWISYHFEGLTSYEAGDYKEAESLLLDAAGETTSKFRKAATLDGLGQVCTALGRFNEAEAYYKDALSMKERALGGKHRDVPATLNNLADLYYILEHTGDIEALYRRALDINKRDQLNLEVCRSLNGLALMHNDAGEFVEAEKLLKRAIFLHEKALRRDHPYMATVLVNLGILYTNLGKYDQAEPLFERAQYIQSTMLRADHPDVAVRLHAMAALYESTGRGQQAQLLAAQAEAIRAKQAALGNLY